MNLPLPDALTFAAAIEAVHEEALLANLLGFALALGVKFLSFDDRFAMLPMLTVVPLFRFWRCKRFAFR
jgi:hypothetical protein